MPLNYLDLQGQVTKLGESTVRRRAELAERLARCQALLHEHAGDLTMLQQKVEEAVSRDKGLRCALPLTERLDSHIPAGKSAVVCTILSADGSQMTPDPHGAVFYGLVNVGVFRMSSDGSGVPETHTWSELIFEEANPDQNEFISEDLVSLRRDVREREILADLAKQESAPPITLTDGPLELYHEPRENKTFEAYFKDYLAALDDLALIGSVTAGYVDRPRAALLIATLELLVPDNSEDDFATAAHPFAGVSDLMLMEELLQPGERSALFALQFRNADKFSGRKALHFFYLNVGSDKTPSLARVEVPLWVVETPGALEQLQAVLVEQARQAGAHPYPYALIRAHETAVVKMDEHEALESLIQAELLRRRLPPGENSQKLLNKLVGKRTRY
jgi:hypothetical protein